MLKSGISDILKLRWTNVNLRTNRIKIVQQKTKGAVISKIDPIVRAILLEFSNGKKNVNTNKLVFEKAPSRDFISKKLKVICKKSGIKKDVSFHVARHTFGTNLSKSTTLATTKVLMGHKSVITTMKYYNDDEGLVNIYAEKNGVQPSKVESDLKD